MIKIEYNTEDLKVELHLDEEGVKYITDLLNSLKENNTNDHIHLFSEEWGGNELDSSKMSINEDSSIIHHLKIYYWKKK